MPRFRVHARRKGFVAKTGLLALILLGASRAEAQDPRYQTRPSDCRVEAPAGEPLALRREDSGIRINGYTGERVITYAADAAGLSGGEIVFCAEYGRVEITDSDDGQVRLQVRFDGFGEGTRAPGESARRVIEDTDVRVHVRAQQGRLLIRVWHSTQGFTAAAQPALVGIRVQVPARGEYRVTGDAYHGAVVVRHARLVVDTRSTRQRRGLAGAGIVRASRKPDRGEIAVAH